MAIDQSEAALKISENIERLKSGGNTWTPEREDKDFADLISTIHEVESELRLMPADSTPAPAEKVKGDPGAMAYELPWISDFLDRLFGEGTSK